MKRSENEQETDCVGLDTNVIVRYLVSDHPAQTTIACRLIERTISSGKKCLLNTIVLCEMVWVLESVYRYSRKEIGDVIEKLLMTAQFEVQESDSVWTALEDYGRTKADFADCLICHINFSLGCSHTITFDRDARDLSGFQVF